MRNLSKANLKIVEKFKIFALISLVIIIVGVVFFAINGLNLGLDFTGGAEIEVELDESVNKATAEAEITDILEGYGLELGGEPRNSTDNGMIILTFRLSYTLNGKEVTNQDEFLELIRTEVKEDLIEYANSVDANFDEEEGIRVHDAGATTAKTAIVYATLAIIAAVIAMLIYIAIRFKPVAGLAAVIALIHDVLIMFALMAVFQIEINSTFIAAIITIVGYSINATIVLFDRIRENQKSPACAGLNNAELANKSIAETLTRSIYTTFTTLVTIVLIAIFGVASIREFALPIIFGLIAGAYSSVLLSGPIWVMLSKVIKGKKSNKKTYAKLAK